MKIAYVSCVGVILFTINLLVVLGFGGRSELELDRSSDKNKATTTTNTTTNRQTRSNPTYFGTFSLLYIAMSIMHIAP